jgi:hypothetical protein
MDHRGAGRARPTADTRRQPRWPSPDDAAPPATPGTGPQQVSGPGTGPQRISGPGTGPQRFSGPGTGPQRFSGPGTGAQPVLAAGSVSPWHTPTGPFPVQDGADDTGFSGPLGAADAIGEAASPGRRRGARTRRSLGSRVGWLATAVVVAAGAGFAAYKFLYEPRVNAPVPPTLRLPTSAPGSPGFDKTLGKWQHIESRSKDPQPLTIAVLYPPQFSLNRQSYVRTAASVTKTCTLAVFGADLQAALQSGHCSQVVRASYLSGDGTMMGTIGVVNLISSNAAQKAGQATGPKEIIAPLTGKKGPTKKLGTGTGVVQAEIKGHYLILMWAEFTNLKSPSGQAQQQALEQFAANLVTGSANIDLSTRMLTGKP